ncbi:hypothetical protein [Tardiphaga sp. 839_C3_N1_4]|uniref:hypothetical protein n=1 Tax=Tardiphaga sp. 839_C3_N1_4 TaxID=3240761 RepID=UPI003F265DC1
MPEPIVDTKPDLLSEEAKSAIRSYMIKIVTPSAIALSIFSAIVGFLLNEGARGGAYATAYGQALSSIVATTTSTTLARGQAETLLDETKKVAKDIQTVRDKVTAQQIEVDGFLKKSFEGVSQSLLADEKFKTSLVGVSDERYRALDKLVNSTRSSLLQASQDARTVPGLAIRCPDGYYLTAVTFQDQSGLAHGALWGPSGTCSRLNVGPPNG